eukprot:3546394-Prorocentrum_lima.AAC.1
MPIYSEENIGPHAVRKEAQEGPVIPMLREDDLATGPVQKATGKEAKERLYRDQAKGPQEEAMVPNPRAHTRREEQVHQGLHVGRPQPDVPNLAGAPPTNTLSRPECL